MKNLKKKSNDFWINSLNEKIYYNRKKPVTVYYYGYSLSNASKKHKIFKLHLSKLSRLGPKEFEYMKSWHSSMFSEISLTPGGALYLYGNTFNKTYESETIQQINKKK